MTGETDLQILLENMRPELNSSPYIFCTIKLEKLSHIPFTPLLVFQEREGVTVIATVEQARENGLQFDATWAWIELSVHSSLSAVGFIAAVSRRLAQAGISINVVSAYYHDHLFVPWEQRDHAMRILHEISAVSDKR